MNQPTLLYVPTRRMLWLRVLIREYLVPKPRWARLLVGPALVAFGAGGIFLASAIDSGALGMITGSMTGIGLGFTSWPMAGAWLAVTRSRQVRHREPVKLTLTNGAVELLRGEDRRLFPLEDLQRVDAIGGETWLRFSGDRALTVPGWAKEGDPAVFVAALRARAAAEREERAAVANAAVPA